MKNKIISLVLIGTYLGSMPTWAEENHNKTSTQEQRHSTSLSSESHEGHSPPPSTNVHETQKNDKNSN